MLFLDDGGVVFTVSEAELDSLKQALRLLLEAERQLRFSNERSKWFTATLLQIGSVLSTGPIRSNSSGKTVLQENGGRTIWCF